MLILFYKTKNRVASIFETRGRATVERIRSVKNGKKNGGKLE